MLKPKNSSLALTLALLLFNPALTALAQKRTAPPAKPATAPVAVPVVTFDTLLADDHYRVYSEVRNVGSLVRSQSFAELLDPLVKLASPPKQFSTVMKWIQARAEPLAGSRLCVASWPSKPTLPQFVFAIELATQDEAKKFEADLRLFLPKLDPKPAASPSPSPQSETAAVSNLSPSPSPLEKPDTFAQLQVKQVGALVLLTEKPISVRELKPRGTKLLAENPNFALARNRFASESVFLYVDFKAIDKEENEQRKKWQEEEKRREEVASANPTPEPPVDPDVETQPTSTADEKLTSQPGTATLSAKASDVQPSNPDSDRAAAAVETFSSTLFPLSMALFGGRAKYPEAIGAALAFEADSYSVRVLVLNSAENSAVPLPFMPQIASGPELTPSSPNVLPGDVDLFVVLSADYPQIYEGMVKALAEQPWLSVAGLAAINRPATPFSRFEEAAGIKVKEDLIPLLGNEIAFVLSKAPPAPSQPATTDNEDRRSVRLPELVPVIAISLKDREAVKGLLAKIIASMGLKGASSLAHTEKRGDTEVISYANLFSYAFIGDFLIFAPDPALTRRVVDSYISGGTLASNIRFRNATRWQSRQLQGQVYVGPELVESYVFAGKEKPQNTSQSNQPIEPLTYMLSNEGLGPLHQVHVSRNLLMMVVAGISIQADQSPILTNESIARSILHNVTASQMTFRDTKGNGRFGSLDELVAAQLLNKDLLERYGYKIELTNLSNRFEVTASPVEYGKTGRRSFFIDDSGILRGGDHGGGPATLSDKPIKE